VDNVLQVQVEEDGDASVRQSWMEISGPMLHWELLGISLVLYHPPIERLEAHVTLLRLALTSADLVVSLIPSFVHTLILSV